MPTCASIICEEGKSEERGDEKTARVLVTSAPDEILLTLGEFVAAARCERFPAAIMQKAKACLLYGLAVGIASVQARQPRLAAAAVDRESSSGPGNATRLIDQRSVDFTAAAFCNAALLHCRVQDDSHPSGHFGVVTIPAALSCAERFHATGSDTLAALIVGYEVALRVGRDHATDLTARGFRTTPAYGVFAAAACGARLMKLDAGTCANALALATNVAGGLREWTDAGTDENAFQVGFAARNGLNAANLAAAGALAALSSLTGGAGFFKAFATDSDRYARRVCERLGEEFEMEAVTYRPDPIGQFVRGVVRGTVALRAQAKFREPRKVEIHMHPFEADFIGTRYAGPFETYSQTLGSALYCAALAWVTGKVTFAGLHEFGNEAVLEIVRKIIVVSDPARARYSPRLMVTLDDGTLLEWEETGGADAYRLTWDDAVRMNEKLCTEAGVSQGRSHSLTAAVAEMDKAASVGKVVAAAAECAAEAQIR